MHTYTPRIFCIFDMLLLRRKETRFENRTQRGFQVERVAGVEREREIREKSRSVKSVGRSVNLNYILPFWLLIIEALNHIDIVVISK